MNEENDEPWSKEQIEAWQHDCWLLRQELGEDYMIHKETDQEYEEDPFEVEQRNKWKEEEEKTRADYLKMIQEEQKRGVYRKTVAQMIEK